MIDQTFCHLHVHTDMSLMDGAMKIETLLAQAKKFGMKKIAITNHGNMINMPQWMWMGEKEGIQIIPGCELYVAWDFPRHLKDSDHKTIYHMVALATNQIGWENLLALCSEGYLSGKYYKPRVDRELLEKYKEGIIFTTACLNGIFNAKMNRQGKDEVVLREDAIELKTLLGNNVFFEVQRHPNTPEQDKGNCQLLKFSQEFNIPVVATCDSHYGLPEHYEAWTSIMTLQMNGMQHHAPNDFYLKSQEQMTKLFEDLPEAISNSMVIANMCEPIKLNKDYKFPVFDTKGLTLEECLAEESQKGLQTIFSKQKITGIHRKEYEARLLSELNIINSMGFPGYMLIVADYIRAAKEKGISVGPGRGSAAGSLVAYALGITNVDPIKYGLLMERFLNPDRISMPDIDTDFGHLRRDEIKEYVKEKYGDDKVASIMTIGTMAARGSLRDISRVLNMTFQEGDAIAKAVPEGKRGKNVYLKTITDPQHEDYSPEFMDFVKTKAQYSDVLRIAKVVEGMAKSSGTHAAGVIISDDKPLIKYTALALDKHDKIVTQFDMKILEKLGLIKFDFLGLSTLTVIQDTLASVKRRYGIDIDLDLIPEDDQKAYQLLCEGDLQGIFQLSGSSGFKNVTMQIQPHSVEEIADITSLYRPGPLDNGFIPMYVDAKKTSKSRYMVEVTNKNVQAQLEELLDPTKGVLIYQEQVMKIVQIMGGYSLGGADILRRIMGKKIPAEMEEQRKVFIEGCLKNGVLETEANEAFDKIAKFAEYGFNKSHAIAYSIITYQTAWLKAHYPKEFLAACLTDEKDNQDKAIAYMNNCKANGIKLLPPDINESGIDFSPTDNGIRFGLAAIKDFGAVGAEYVIKEKEKGGPFKSYIDFLKRINLQKVNKSKIETLIRVGCFDSIANN
jgi:DNA polymerase-3 subunit alpha